jgi:hypothetical protein
LWRPQQQLEYKQDLWHRLICSLTNSSWKVLWLVGNSSNSPKSATKTKHYWVLPALKLGNMLKIIHNISGASRRRIPKSGCAYYNLFICLKVFHHHQHHFTAHKRKASSSCLSPRTYSHHLLQHNQ